LSSEFIFKSIPLYSLALSFEGIKAAANVSIGDSEPDSNFGNRHKYFVQYSDCFSQDYFKICRQNWNKIFLPQKKLFFKSVISENILKLNFISVINIEIFLPKP
jgi:hypothetical protein